MNFYDDLYDGRHGANARCNAREYVLALLDRDIVAKIAVSSVELILSDVYWLFCPSFNFSYHIPSESIECIFFLKHAWAVSSVL